MPHLTSQFPHCGNAFAMDTYRGCEMGCQYCFANNRGGHFRHMKEYRSAPGVTEGQIENLRKLFAGERKSSDLSLLIEHRVPVHLGGMCDPWTAGDPAGVTHEFLRVASDYPVMLSTKTASVPEETWKVLRPEYHAFQLSVTGFPDDVIRRFEEHTPLTSERIAFARELKERGFTVFIRIQPLVVYEWAEMLVQELGYEVDGFTVEHLKLPVDHREKYAYLRGEMEALGLWVPMKPCGREFEIAIPHKQENIERLKDLPRVAPINVGDNDLRTLSETPNCCGLTLCPPAFAHWITFNSMAIEMGGYHHDDWWPEQIPPARCSLYQHCVKPGWTYRDYVEQDRIEKYGNPDQLMLGL